MTSGLGGGIDPVFGLFDTRLVRPVEPLSLWFYRWRGHVGTGGARSRWIAAKMRLNKSPLVATSASWNVMARA